MEALNPKGPTEKEEEQEEEQFLNSSPANKSQNERYRNIPKKEKQ